MQPITPLLETPTGRLAELIHLLSDTPLSDAVAAVAQTSDEVEENDDPWWVIAGALVEVRRRQAHEFQTHDLRMPA